MGSLLLLWLFTAAATSRAPQDSQERVSAKEEAARKAFQETDRPGDGAEAVGMSECSNCHGELVTGWKASKHQTYLRTVVADPEGACEYCHGAGSLHAEEGDGTNILHFPNWSGVTVKRTTDFCAGCHGTIMDKPHWTGNTHAMGGVSCVDCHDFHGDGHVPFLLDPPNVRVTANTAFRYDTKRPTEDQAVIGACLNCHTEQGAQLRQRSHHPLLEGRMNCADCHELHKTKDPMLLPDDRTREQLCFDCHTDKRGPYVFEHEVAGAGGLGEGCLSCHRPHGSPNPKLATVFGRALCVQCHTDINADPNHLGRPGNCWRVGCHADIHGSNTNPRFFR